MEHFSLDEWHDFAAGSISDEKRQIMEEHLLNCDSCLEMYTEILTETSDSSYEFSSPEFTHKVMKEVIAQANYKASTGNIARNNFHRTFMYYVAAASITLALTASGIFNYAAYKLPLASAHAVSIHVDPLKFINNGWTDRLASKTSNIIENIILKQ
jgi:predicted anti-sigma-YlaC factor YlaD